KTAPRTCTRTDAGTERPATCRCAACCATIAVAWGNGGGMLTLYGAKGSGSAAIEAALTTAGLPFRPVEAASWEAGPGLDALKRVNPLAQIPTLVLEDGKV